MKYKIVKTFSRLSGFDTLDDLQKEVNKLMAEGWEPVGSPVITPEQLPVYAQAMIKRG